LTSIAPRSTLISSGISPHIVLLFCSESVIRRQQWTRMARNDSSTLHACFRRAHSRQPNASLKVG